MAIDRYSKDYRLNDSLDERGRIRTEAEYIGKHFRFRRSGAARQAAKKTLALCVLAWIGFLAALYPVSDVGRALYAVLPCAFTALPLWMLTATAASALRVKEPFVRREQERFTVRFPAAALLAAILPGLALLGGGLRMLFGAVEHLGGDIVFLAGNAAVLLAAILCRQFRPALECAEKKP